jgi:hypothetical protein
MVLQRYELNGSEKLITGIDIGQTFAVNKQIIQILILIQFKKNCFHKDKFLNYLFEFLFLLNNHKILFLFFN